MSGESFSLVVKTGLVNPPLVAGLKKYKERPPILILKYIKIQELK